MQFLKRGVAAHEAAAAHEAKQKARRDASSGPLRFFMKPGETRTITFLDGALTPEGLLDITSWAEHQVQMNGNWRNWFNCTQQQLSTDEPCPICEMEGYSSSNVSFLTIIDHTPYQDKNGVLQTHVKRLFACKQQTADMLQMKAARLGGLVGCTFEVQRSMQDKSPNTGDMFEVMYQNPLEVIAQQCGYQVQGDPKDSKVCQPYPYEQILKYHSAAELRALGFGNTIPGGAPQMNPPSPPAPAALGGFGGAAQQPPAGFGQQPPAGFGQTPQAMAPPAAPAGFGQPQTMTSPAMTPPAMQPQAGFGAPPINQGPPAPVQQPPAGFGAPAAPPTGMMPPAPQAGPPAGFGAPQPPADPASQMWGPPPGQGPNPAGEDYTELL